ncbi:MAG: DNA-methyltransferase, partial [Promethearchaeota archaeon]
MTADKKVYKFGDQIIYYSSCEDMKEIGDNTIDVIITSPPYNVGKKYSSVTGTYNDRLDYNEYLDFLYRVFKECYRVSRDNVVFFLNIGDSAKSQGKSEDVVRQAVKAGFKRLQTVIWIKSIFGKGHYTPSGGNRRLNNLWEFIFILIKSDKYHIDPKSIGIPYSDKSNIGRYTNEDRRDAGDVWFIPYAKTTGKTIKKGHEAPFPIELPMRCLKLVPDAKVVLDPFAGTGSTLRAAHELGLTGYGYECFPNEETIRERMTEPVNLTKTPLLPQLENYCDFLTTFLDSALDFLSEKQIMKIASHFTSKRRKQ